MKHLMKCETPSDTKFAKRCKWAMDRLQQELPALPGLEQLSASQVRDLPWRVKELVLIALFREQLSSNAVSEDLQSKSRDRKLERKADKLLDDVDHTALRKKEESYRADFMQVAAAELARLGAPALITWQKLVFDKDCCAQAFRLLLTRIKSSRRSVATGVSTNSSSLLAARYAAGRSRQGTGGRRQSNNNTQDDDEHRENRDAITESDEPEGRTRFPPLKPTQRRPSATRKNGRSLASHSPSDDMSTAMNWNSDTTIETPPEEDELDNLSVHASPEPVQDRRTSSHQTGAGISIERTVRSKQSSYFASNFEKNQLQSLQEENVSLTGENTKLRDEIKQLEALNSVLQDEKSSNSLLDTYPNSIEFAQRRIKLLQAQNMQLQRQVRLLQDAIQARENAEVNLMAALNHWRSVIQAGREEAKAAGADQKATSTSTEQEGTGARQPIKWMLAVPDKLLSELKRVEGQIRGGEIAANTCFETKLRVSNLSSSLLRNQDISLKLHEIYGREPSSLAHLRVERVQQLEDALGSVSAELDQLSAQVLQRFPPTVSTTEPMRSGAYELGRSVRELLLEVGAFGVVVPTPSASTTTNAAATIHGESTTAVDIINALSSTSGMARGSGGAREREKQAKVMLKQLHARYIAMENDIVSCRREAEYWRTAWHTQENLLRKLAKRVRHLGHKKMEWCQHNVLTPMVNLVEVFASFQQAYDENTTRQNPYLPLLVETLRMEHPMLEDALQQWQDYSRSVQLKMDELVADYEANRLVLLSSSSKQKSRAATLVSEVGDDTLPSMSQQLPVH